MALRCRARLSQDKARPLCQAPVLKVVWWERGGLGFGQVRLRLRGVSLYLRGVRLCVGRVLNHSRV